MTVSVPNLWITLLPKLTCHPVLNPKKKYNLEYYMSLVEKIVNMGCHIIGIKDSEFCVRPGSL